MVTIFDIMILKDKSVLCYGHHTYHFSFFSLVLVLISSMVT